MKSKINNTSVEIHERMIEGYRQMTPAQKAKQVTQLTQAVQKLALARIRKQYGDIPEREQRLRLASLWFDRETMIKVFDWDPHKEGY
jgi:hypothetical protein